MPTSCQNLFDDSRHSPPSVGKVYKDIFIVFREHWKPLISIYLLNLLSFIGTSILLGIFVAVVFAELFADFSSIASGTQSSDMGNGRYLVNYMVGSGATRALDYTNYGSDNQDQMSGINFEEFSDTVQRYSGQIFVIVITIITVMSLVACTFAGAMAHTAAEAYSGGTPGACKSIRFGWGHKWQIFIYQIVVLFLVFAVLMCMIFSMASGSYSVIFLSFLAALAFFIFFGTVMVAGIPAIIVEGMSSIAAIRRSYQLCKGEFCFIFCNNFCAQLLVLVFTIIMNEILSIFPDVIAVLCHLGINILVSVLGSMLPFVIYMSIRIRNENYTQEDLCLELLGNKAIVNATELGNFKRAEVV